MMMHHRPTSSAHGIARPGRDAPPQQIAEYYQRMLMADGAIPSLSFSPFEPPVGGAFAPNYQRMLMADGAIPSLSFSPFEPPRVESADFFYGRQAPRAGRAAANLFEPDAVSPSSPGDDSGEGQGPAPSAFAQTGDLASMLFAPRPSTAGPTEDDLITAHLEEVRQAERELMASLRISPEEDEELIREQARLLASAQRTAGTSTPVHADAKPVESVAAAVEDLTRCALASSDGELEGVLAASRATSEAESDAALQRALEMSTTIQSVGEEAAAALPESAEAGIDIPFETPRSLLDDVSEPQAASTSKATRAKNKRGKGRGSNV